MLRLGAASADRHVLATFLVSVAHGTDVSTMDEKNPALSVQSNEGRDTDDESDNGNADNDPYEGLHHVDANPVMLAEVSSVGVHDDAQDMISSVTGSLNVPRRERSSQCEQLSWA